MLDKVKVLEPHSQFNKLHAKNPENRQKLQKVNVYQVNFVIILNYAARISWTTSVSSSRLSQGHRQPDGPRQSSRDMR